jgi:hypothetical protein
MENTTIICKNCDTPFEGKHCPTCGQKASVKRIKMEDFYEDSIKKLTHWDKGLARTALDLLKNPGQMTRDYINGKRAKYTKPLSFLLLISAISIFFFSPSDFQDSVTAFSSKKELDDVQKKFNQWIFEHLSLMTALMLPFLAFFNRLFNRKADVNYAEHLVVATYWSAGSALISIPFTLLFKLLHMKAISSEAMMIQVPVTMLFYSWAYVVFFKKSNRFTGVVQGLLAYLLAYIVFIIVFSIIAGIVGIVLFKLGIIHK